MIKFSVIIVSYNNLELLINCLNSIYNATSDEVEIIVVDNNSDRIVVEFLEKQENILLIKNTSNVGFGKANNQAVKIAKGKWFVLINNDTKVELDFFEKAEQFFQNNSGYDIMGPLVLSADGFPQPSFYNKDYFRQLIFPSYSFRKFVRILSFGTNVSEKKKLLFKKSAEYSFVNTHEVDFLSGVCLFINRKIYENVGLFDENYFMYVEDLDFCLKAKRNGYKIAFFPEIMITHFIKNISQKPSISWFNYNNNIKYLFRKNFAWYINIVAQPFLSLKALTKHTIIRLRSQK
jgi:GT2 family glycosyltransferase